jgi:hypothetical protein
MCPLDPVYQAGAFLPGQDIKAKHQKAGDELKKWAAEYLQVSIV